jgi:hypothetical protein
MLQEFEHWVTGSYAFAVIGGPVLLGLAIVYGVMRSKRGRGHNMDGTSLEDISRQRASPEGDRRSRSDNSRTHAP